MRGGHKGLQWCGFAWFLVRFCGNFYFKLRYCGFTKPSSVCRFLICYSVWCFYVFLCGFAVFVPALRPSPKNGPVFSNGPLIIFEIPYCYCGIQGNLRHLKEWDIILQAQTFHCITTKYLEQGSNSAKNSTRPWPFQHYNPPTTGQARYTAKEPAFNFKSD